MPSPSHDYSPDSSFILIPPPSPINSHQQDRRQRNKPHRPTQRNPRDIILIASLSQHQVSHFVQNHSAPHPKRRRSQKRHPPIACPESQKERRRNFDQDSNEQVMNQMSARINMLNPHQVKIKPKAQYRPQHRQQNQQQRLLGSRTGRLVWHWALEFYRRVGRIRRVKSGTSQPFAQSGLLDEPLIRSPRRPEL